MAKQYGVDFKGLLKKKEIRLMKKCLLRNASHTTLLIRVYGVLTFMTKL